MKFLEPVRRPSHELLDEHDAPMPDVIRSLEDLRWINRYAGGQRIYRSLVRELTGNRQPADILDLGTGSSDLMTSIPLLSTRSCGLDFKFEHLAWGRDAHPKLDIQRVAADAFRLPFRDDAFDVVTSGHFFHHFALDENRRIIEEALRVARIGVAINDTRRHIAPLAFVKLVGLTPRFGRITKEDAPASVLQAYTLSEMRAFASTLGHRARVVRRFPYRFGLLVWK
jgi:ubiquinone/menaquinone biosynthesis C-methylase UbiE